MDVRKGRTQSAVRPGKPGVVFHTPHPVETSLKPGPLRREHQPTSRDAGQLAVAMRTRPGDPLCPGGAADFSPVSSVPGGVLRNGLRPVGMRAEGNGFRGLESLANLSRPSGIKPCPMVRLRETKNGVWGMGHKQRDLSLTITRWLRHGSGAACEFHGRVTAASHPPAPAEGPTGRRA